MRRVSEHRKKKKKEEARVKQHTVHFVLRGFYNVLYRLRCYSGIYYKFKVHVRTHVHPQTFVK